MQSEMMMLEMRKVLYSIGVGRFTGSGVLIIWHSCLLSKGEN